MSFNHLYGEWIEPASIICPSCENECETFYLDDDNNVLGCDSCITSVDAYDFMARQEPGDDCDAKYQEWKDNQL